jgi:protein-L-isoaspartate(D-aspartate) O-methyltransferase
MLIEDTYRHKGLRNRMVDDLIKKGITDLKVLEALRKVPRHQFFQDQIFIQKAYEDIAFQIGEGQTISHPSTVGLQTQLLSIQKGEKVLEIGTGSGYQTAILHAVGAKIFSIERQHALFVRTKKLLESMQIKATLTFGDGYLGWPAFAPFDKIIVTAGAPFIPPALCEQLKINGKLIIPVGTNGVQLMHIVTKKENGEIDIVIDGEFKFVPLLADRN